jgi:hypothetical protein
MRATAKSLPEAPFAITPAANASPDASRTRAFAPLPVPVPSGKSCAHSLLPVALACFISANFPPSCPALSRSPEPVTSIALAPSAELLASSKVFSH